MRHIIQSHNESVLNGVGNRICPFSDLIYIQCRTFCHKGSGSVSNQNIGDGLHYFREQSCNLFTSLATTCASSISKIEVSAIKATGSNKIEQSHTAPEMTLLARIY